MDKYKCIQMLGMVLSTTPGNLTSIEEVSDEGNYLGYEDTKTDFCERIKLLKEGIETAIRHASDDESVLKVFVVPEFYFRGIKGAYVGESNAVFGTYLKPLITFLEEPQYENWLFVLGTLLSATKPIDTKMEPTKSLLHMGDSLLDVYHHLHPKKTDEQNLQSNSPPIPLSSILRTLDEIGVESEEIQPLRQNQNTDKTIDESYKDVLLATLNYCDTKANVEVWNRCFIVGGGRRSPEIRSVLKKYKSKEDFILNSIEDNYLQTITCYPVIPNGSEVKHEMDDYYGIFEYEGIDFGIEICLDHSRGRLLNHVKSHMDDAVDVQIIPSCGMTIRANAVVAKEGGIVFNCDGEYEVNDGVSGDKCHTTLKTVKNQYYGEKATVLSKYHPVKEKITLTHKPELYPGKDCTIHVYMPIKKA